MPKGPDLVEQLIGDITGLQIAMEAVTGRLALSRLGLTTRHKSNKEPMVFLQVTRSTRQTKTRMQYGHALNR